jgi:3-hydroxy acid dehydrogenase / malonic semialdehyde reductase
MKKALITGATAGIGLATSELLASEGYELILCGRRGERLKALQKKFDRSHILEFDISSRESCESAISQNSALFEGLDLLFNNAGLAKGVDPIQEGNFDDWDAVIDTNVKGLLYLTRLILPYMLKAKRGHIINMGSVAGRWTYPRGTIYCATKFAVRAISEGLRLDLMGTPIRVSNIEPGMVETEFTKVRLGDEERAKAVYKGMKPLTASDIAECVLWCLNRPAHVNIQELVIFPTDQAAISNVSRQGL